MPEPSSKITTESDIIAQIQSGMTIGIGGWGSRRKPMSLIRAICNSEIKDLKVVSYGGPDLGLLCAAGKVKHAAYGFVSLDSIPLEPHFRKVRQEGVIEFTELDEGAFYLGLLAAAHRMPFYPTRAGLGSDMLKMNPEIKTIKSPYPPNEDLVAVPAFEIDISLIHMNRADKYGNGQFLGPDLYFDDLFAMAAKKTFMTTEAIVDTADFSKMGTVHTQKISRIFVDGVVEVKQGAHFTQCLPDYERDESFQKQYAAAAKDPELWEEFWEKYIAGKSHEQYLEAVNSGGSDK